jgi:hypothetical protein
MQVSSDVWEGDRDHRAVNGIHEKTEADAGEDKITVHFVTSTGKTIQKSTG